MMIPSLIDKAGRDTPISKKTWPAKLKSPNILKEAKARTEEISSHVPFLQVSSLLLSVFFAACPIAKRASEVAQGWVENGS